MLRVVIVLLLLALIAALFGFTDIAVAMAGVAKIIFFIFLALLIIAFILLLVGRR